MVIGEFQMDRHHLYVKRAPHKTIYGHKKKVYLEQNISFGSHCMA